MLWSAPHARRPTFPTGPFSLLTLANDGPRQPPPQALTRLPLSPSLVIRSLLLLLLFSFSFPFSQFFFIFLFFLFLCFFLFLFLIFFRFMSLALFLFFFYRYSPCSYTFPFSFCSFLLLLLLLLFSLHLSHLSDQRSPFFPVIVLRCLFHHTRSPCLPNLP